jgi:rod shape-determining protein MreB
MASFKKSIGIDLGTANVLVYVKGKGVVLQEPSVVAIDNNNGRILAIGAEAKTMLGRTPGNITAIRPLKDGVISDFDVTERMLKYFIGKVAGRSRIFRPQVVVGIPSGATEVEKRAVEQAVIAAGGSQPIIVEEPVAAAIGSGIDITEPTGNMVVDIGGGTTDIAVLSLGGIVASDSIKVAGDVFDTAIVRYMRNTHKLLIGERTAEELKIAIGTAYEADEKQITSIRGRDLVTGLPKAIDVNSEEIRVAIEDHVETIITGIHSVLEKTPPELASDISDVGLYLAGGGSKIKGLNLLIKDRLGLEVNFVDNAEETVVYGTGKILDNVNLVAGPSARYGAMK